MAMKTTPSMKRFDTALELVEAGDAVFLNKLYWANVCETCREGQSVVCGRGHAVLQMMGRLTYSVAVEIEVS